MANAPLHFSGKSEKYVLENRSQQFNKSLDMFCL